LPNDFSDPALHAARSHKTFYKKMEIAQFLVNVKKNNFSLNKDASYSNSTVEMIWESWA
jgi:hypothetical protein